MIHLMVVLRTLEETKECRLFTKHYEPMVLDTSRPHTQILLNLHSDLPDFWGLERWASTSGSLSLSHSKNSSSSRPRNLVPKPHRWLRDVVFFQDLLPLMISLNTISQAGVSSCNKAKNTDDTCSTAASFDCIAGESPSQLEADITENSLDDTHTDFTSDTSSFERTSEELHVNIVPLRMCSMFVNAHVASALMTCMVSSPLFRWSLLWNLRKKFQRPASYPAGSCEKDVDIFVNYLLDIVSVWPVQRIDYAWGWFMNHTLARRILLEEAMAWLSTLGGAHSSLGEYFHHHCQMYTRTIDENEQISECLQAERAGEISLKQLKIALQLGDPLTVARCHMFWAYSLMQRGHWRKCTVIVRRVYKLASTHPVVDMRLINMCLAAWTRLQHLHRIHRQKKRTHAGTGKTSGGAATALAVPHPPGLQ